VLLTADTVAVAVEAVGISPDDPHRVADVGAVEIASAVFGVADVAATISVDEHIQGVHAGAVHAAVSDAASTRAGLVAA
jgi:hypothetical protein